MTPLVSSPLDSGGAGRPLHAPDDGPAAAKATIALRELLAGLRRYEPGGAPLVFSLAGAREDTLAQLLDALGEGEVRITVTGQHRYLLTETALTGVWHVATLTADGTVTPERLEIADVPAVVRAAALHGTTAELSIGTPPAGTMNALPLLAELRHRSQHYRPGEPNHVLSFSLLPMTPEDLAYVDAQLGTGPVAAVVHGYGNCRVALTARRHLWRVQHFNVGGALVLDTVEVGDVPVALRASPEDFEDSLQRLEALLEG